MMHNITGSYQLVNKRAREEGNRVRATNSCSSFPRSAHSHTGIKMTENARNVASLVDSFLACHAIFPPYATRGRRKDCVTSQKSLCTEGYEKRHDSYLKAWRYVLFYNGLNDKV